VERPAGLGDPRRGAPGDLPLTAANAPRPITSEEALELILEDVPALGIESVRLEEADGRAAARAVVAARALPGWDNAAKDGYAVRAADLASPGASLPIAGGISAGDPPGAALPPASTLLIMTGAPVPAGADAIVPVEDTAGPHGRGRFAEPGERVTFGASPRPGDHVRLAGADVVVGEPVLEPGVEVGAGRLALLAAMGEAAVEVHRRPHVVVIPTGDELVRPGVEPAPGQLFSSNAPALAALARRAGAVARTVDPVPDDRLLIRAAVFEALETADVVVTTGGVSAGERDHVRGVIEEAAGGLVFWRVRMRPGEPLVFARTRDLPGVGRVAGRWLFGLPGNPTSALVTFLEFVRPLLRRLGGFSDVFLPAVRARLAEPVRAEPGRRSFLRVRLDRDDVGGFVAAPAGPQGSGFLRPFADAQGLLVCGPDRTDLAAGEAVTVQLLDLPQGPREPYPPWTAA
jgi:molybdopterin molybdotransferase